VEDIPVSTEAPIVPDVHDLELKLLSFTRRARQSRSSLQGHAAGGNSIARSPLDGAAYGEDQNEND
jgi:hypothetical protein